MIAIIFLVVLSSIFCSLGQVCFKKATNSLRPVHSRRLRSYLRYIKDILGLRWIWSGLFLMALGLAAWLMAIAQGDLSLIYPIGSLYYIFVLVLARVFLGEKSDGMRLWGTVFIFMGILLIVRSGIS